MIVHNPPLTVTLNADVIANSDNISRDEWLELRRAGIGGSDAAASMGLSPFTSPYALYLDKTDPVADVDKEIFKWGRRLEEPIAQAFAEETGLEVTYSPFMLRSKAHNWLLANPDRYVGTNAILECKNVGANNAHEWADGPPLHYRIQGQTYLAVSGLELVYFAALVGGRKLVIYEVARDEELIGDIVAGTERFWTLVQLRRPPEIDGSESTTEAIKAQHAKPTLDAAECGPEMLELVAQYHARAAVAAHAKLQVEEIANKIKATLGAHDAAKVDEQIVVTWKSQTRKSYTVGDTTFRKLDVKKIKESK